MSSARLCATLPSLRSANTSKAAYKGVRPNESTVSNSCLLASVFSSRSSTISGCSASTASNSADLPPPSYCWIFCPNTSLYVRAVRSREGCARSSVKHSFKPSHLCSSEQRTVAVFRRVAIIHIRPRSQQERASSQQLHPVRWQSAMVFLCCPMHEIDRSILFLNDLLIHTIS